MCQSAFSEPEKLTTGDRVFEDLKYAVFKLKSAISPESPKASYGTAFVIDKKNSYLATNYHVVSSAVLEDENYKIYLVDQKKSYPAKIISLDVVHDLALIQVKGFDFKKEIPFAKKAPAQGELIYSVGQPEDLNMSIVSGTFNGEINHGAYSVVHMSSPINSGMSGGPTVNGQSQLVGINVSRLVGSQNISFSVPARFLTKMIEDQSQAVKNQVAEKPKTGKKSQLVKLIEGQLIDLQASLTKDFVDNSGQGFSVGEWTVNQSPESLKCWSDQQKNKEVGYQTFKQVCYLDHSAFLADGLNTGSYEVNYTTISSNSLNGFRFFRILNNMYNGGSFQFFFFSNSDKYTKYSCFDQRMLNRNGIPFQVNVCARGYHDFKDILNVEIKAVSLNANGDEIVMKAELRGFVIENVKSILKILLDNIDRGGK